MSNDLIINSDESGVVIALLSDKKLIELHKEQTNNNFLVGDIFLGTVRKIMPGLNAAFIDVGYEKDAFLHYLDLGPKVKSLKKLVRQAQQGGRNDGSLSNFKIEPEIVKTGKMGQVLSKNQQIVVQVTKEPISSKGPRLSTDISIAGRYMVLVPFINSVSVSRKIGDPAERERLKKLTTSIKPQNFGVIVRTVAENKPVEELHKDMLSLVDKWNSIFAKLKHAKPKQKLLGEMDRSTSLIRDLLNENFNSIVVNNEVLYEDVRNYVAKISPSMEKIVRKHTGKTPIFEQFGVEKQIKSLFGKTVTMDGGAYLIIEHTEACHVIDVNSGSKQAVVSQDENALNVNLAACKEIARQLKLRDMGGIIIIDFIDMRSAAYRKEVYAAMKEAMEADRAKHTILQISKFGLMQITRQRVRPEMNIVTSEVCPTCEGTGTIQASILLIDEVEKNLSYIINTLNLKNITLTIHPYMGAFVTKGIISLRVKWFFKYGKWIKIETDNSYHMAEYHFFNNLEEEIKLQ